MTNIMWAIEGKHGLYTGTWLTKAAAITAHCRNLSRPGGKLDVATDWPEYVALGDRAVRVRLTVVKPARKTKRSAAQMVGKTRGLTFREAVDARRGKPA